LILFPFLKNLGGCQGVFEEGHGEKILDEKLSENSPNANDNSNNLAKE